MTVGELKKTLNKIDNETMEVVLLERGGFIVQVDDAYVSDEDDESDDEPVFVISH